jgi:hypothetical protein
MKIIGIDIGGNSIKYAVFDENRVILSKGRVKTPVDESINITEKNMSYKICTM